MPEWPRAHVRVSPTSIVEQNLTGGLIRGRLISILPFDLDQRQRETMPLSLLIADGDPKWSAVCQRLLVESGYEVAIASDGHLAAQTSARFR